MLCTTLPLSASLLHRRVRRDVMSLPSVSTLFAKCAWKEAIYLIKSKAQAFGAEEFARTG